MQRLHLVGFTSELDGLIFSGKNGARSGGYVVALDTELLDAIREVLDRRDRPRTPAPVAASMSPAHARDSSHGSALTPREIQARLRAGRDIEEVAMAAGVDETWVRRFATPVLAERAHVAQRAQAAVLETEGAGPSAESLARSVAANLNDRGMVLTADELVGGWDAFQVRESAWAVEFRAPTRGREFAARWGFDVRTGRLTALNAVAAELGWVGPEGTAISAYAGIDDRAGRAGGDGAAAPAPPVVSAEPPAPPPPAADAEPAASAEPAPAAPPAAPLRAPSRARRAPAPRTAEARPSRGRGRGRAAPTE